ncbi:COX15/CtaA family protein [Salinibacillus xinjiangensis]|uniref:Heme A synthase n=1 Tax=Salinibacillus xinjiangensis TaxID=1229268 RepID=A0A6G1X4D2_9BACI|nr:COX15/CtaA family protein [Salinibacillus xinjiangensis]MRG85851.1 hypothetical protein [Salinibacillus xinjiangensis]
MALVVLKREERARHLKRLAFLTIIIAYFLFVFVGYVASSKSGMGCGPDWPLCNGVLTPLLKRATLIEYAHRVIGAILFFISLFLFVRIIRSKPANQTRKVANWMMVLLVIQSIEKHLSAIILLLVLTLGFGAYIKHQDYGLACGGKKTLGSNLGS